MKNKILNMHSSKNKENNFPNEFFKGLNGKVI
jgi:hypothetical protein